MADLTYYRLRATEEEWKAAREQGALPQEMLDAYFSDDEFLWRKHGLKVCCPDIDVCCFAVYGHVDCVAAVWENEKEICDPEWVCLFAAQNGHTAVLEWLVEQGVQLPNTLSAIAANGGHTACVQWLAQQGIPVTQDTCEGAVTSGDMECVQWCLETLNEPLWADLCMCAVMADRLDVLQWLYDRGCPAELEGLAWYAAAFGNTHIVQWLQGIGGKVTERVCEAAAESDDVACLEFCLQGKDQLWPQLMESAVVGDAIHTVRWLHARDCPMNWQKCWDLAETEEIQQLLEEVQERNTASS